MTAIRWEDSGQNRSNISLNDVHLLAIDAGFVWLGTDGLIPSKRANLAAFFEHYDVNSLSAFKLKWARYSLSPPGKTPSPSSSSSSSSSSSPPLWVSTFTPSSQYVGQALPPSTTTPQGMGILLTQGSKAPILYIGQFKNGRKDGFGAITTPRGEMYYGPFQDDIFFGPGIYHYPHPTTGTSNNIRYKVCYKGMFNGRPMGRGVVVWSSGEEEWGVFEGEECAKRIEEEEENGEERVRIRGVVMVAEKNGEEGKKVVDEVKKEMGRWGGEFRGDGVKLIERGGGGACREKRGGVDRV